MVLFWQTLGTPFLHVERFVVWESRPMLFLEPLRAVADKRMPSNVNGRAERQRRKEIKELER